MSERDEAADGDAGAANRNDGGSAHSADEATSDAATGALAADDSATPASSTGEDAEATKAGLRLSRRGWTVVTSGVLVLVFVLIGSLVRVPYVALGPGPTYDTLGESDGMPVVQVDAAQPSYPTSGELRMTTVSLNDEISLFGALGIWASGRYALAPREEYYKPGETNEQVKKENVKLFKDSQSNAEVAALRRLGYPVKVLAQQIESGSPADRELAAGDQLLVVNGKQITNEEDVRNALKGTHPDQEIDITVRPEDGQEQTKKVKLGRNDDRQEGFLGLQPIDRADVKFNIKITLEDVGGPSAGLMFALAIVDRMTPGDEVAGRHVAGTGEITEKGEVGPIGGISFKVAAAREAGATDFLVPANNCAEAAAAAPDGLNLIKVSTLDDALGALEDLKAGRQAPTCSAG